jgi:uncharacterized protein YndB with AHSA1/START domain
MATLYHQVWINAPVAKVYAALASAEGLGNWWAPHTSTETESGLVLAHDPGPEHGEVRMEVVGRIPNKRVEWKIVSTHPRTSPASAWTGTNVIFEIAERENPGPRLGISGGGATRTVLEFRHTGWDENSEFLGFCNLAWGETLVMLRNWCESP